MRHRIRGWDAEVSHEFGRPSPTLGLAKHFKFATLRATYDVADREAGLQYKRRCEAYFFCLCESVCLSNRV